MGNCGNCRTGGRHAIEPGRLHGVLTVIRGFPEALGASTAADAAMVLEARWVAGQTRWRGKDWYLIGREQVVVDARGAARRREEEVARVAKGRASGSRRLALMDIIFVQAPGCGRALP